jgi:hypothetical protein
MLTTLKLRKKMAQPPPGKKPLYNIYIKVFAPAGGTTDNTFLSLTLRNKPTIPGHLISGLTAGWLLVRNVSTREIEMNKNVVKLGC